MVQLFSPFSGHMFTQGKRVKDATRITIVTPCGCFSVPVLFEEDSDGQSVWRDQPDFDDMTDFGYLYYKRTHKN